MVVYGYNGLLLRVNLSTGKIRMEDVDENVLKTFLGGKGLAIYLLYREVPPGSDPLGLGNKLVFAPGGLSGIIPGASKVAVAAKSPLTRLLNDSYSGDAFGPMLKKAGFDAIVVEGLSDEPVYLWVHDGEAELRDARRLWGIGVYETTSIVKKETNPEASVAAIGPAGERLVRIANILFDTQRAAGRGGLGAVMGSKKLKAIAVYGRRRPEVLHPEKLEGLAKELYEKYATSPDTRDSREYGTTNGLIVSSKLGMSPAYNYNKPYLPQDLAIRLAGREIKKLEVEPPKYVHGRTCPIKCARYVRITRNNKVYDVKPEYENLAMLGAATGIFDLKEVLYLNYLVNNLGLDSISTGNTIAWFLELVEKGLVEPGEFGFNGSYGNIEAVEKLIISISKRQGVGAILAEGVKRASEILGRGHEYAVHVKGLEAPAWDPRGWRGFGLSYATSDIGASHLRGWPHPYQPPNTGPAKNVVQSLIEDRDKKSIYDHLGICIFIPYREDEITSLLEYSTGWRLSWGDLRDTSSRTEALSRIYAVLEWVTPPIDDKALPRKWWIPEEEGPAKGSKIFLDENDLDEALREYYRLRGWNVETGVPEPITLKRLGLEWAIPDAERASSIVRKRRA